MWEHKRGVINEKTLLQGNEANLWNSYCVVSRGSSVHNLILEHSQLARLTTAVELNSTARGMLRGLRMVEPAVSGGGVM
jgi:hypothetical protein